MVALLLPLAIVVFHMLFRKEALLFQKASHDMLDVLYEIEKASYPKDEAATREKLSYRIKHANDLFLVAMFNDKPIGYICATATLSDTLDYESMSTHSTEGSLVCIHSVVVREEFR